MTDPQTPGFGDPFASAAPQPPSGGGGKVACPCRCGCGNSTDTPVTQVESPSSVRFLRCQGCAGQGHFGPRWNRDDTTPVGTTGQVRTGDRGTQVVVREPHRRALDPEDVAWEAAQTQRLEQSRRDTAREKWLTGLPERWQMPFEPGERLEPEIEQRLARLEPGSGGEHATSVVVVGPFGSGKTWVCYSYARSAVERNLLWPQEITIGTEAEIMEPLALASPWELNERAAKLLRPTMKMLVIDDVGSLGVYKDPRNRHTTWGKVVNWCYEHKRTLVLSTNLPLGDDGPLADWVGTMAYERLRHMVGTSTVFREENKRAEMSALWEREYLASLGSAEPPRTR